ncbi:MAG: TRAP transporter small permease [Desulfohalobiaceae bacterium]|nr:TRAP transporter small permease [Desulfohalobiaceae bacterium]
MFSATMNFIIDVLKKLAGILLVGMMLLTCADVVGNLFGYPVLGSEEIVSLCAAVLLAFALPMVHRDKGHIGVDLLYLRFPPLLKRINNIFLSLISGVFFFLTARECYEYGNELKATGEVSSTLQLPIYYVLYAISVACFILFLVLLFEFISLVKGERNE